MRLLKFNNRINIDYVMPVFRAKVILTYKHICATVVSAKLAYQLHCILMLLLILIQNS